MNDHRLRVYEDMLGLVSSLDNPTPIVRLNRISPFKHTQVYCKLEWYNPFGAVKDRVAYNLICDAEAKGLLGVGQKLVEPTSGNTGMGLAMVSNAKGYKLTTPLSNKIPLEKRTVLRMFGSTVLEMNDSLCPAPGAPEGAIATAMEMGERPDFHMLNQYVNEANPEAHMKTTGPEIWRQTGGTVTHFVAGLGTCGTITGTGRYLKSQNPGVKVLGVHPVEGHDIPGVRSLKQLTQTALFKPEEYDQMTAIDNQTAYNLCLRLNREESIIAGPSSAMALAGAFEMVPDEPGNIVVVIFPDNVFKYASSVVKHLPQVRSDKPQGDPDAVRMQAMIENVRNNDRLRISQEEAYDLWKSDRATFVDVRDFETYSKEHIQGAVPAPLDDIETYAPTLPEDTDRPIVTVCFRGNLSLAGVLYLKSYGYSNVRSLDGGTIAWADAGRAIERG